MRKRGVEVAVMSIGLLVGMGTGSQNVVRAQEPKQEGLSVKATNPAVVVETSHGTMKAELWPDKAPATVSNFLAYVDGQFFDATIFHRVINNFMIQGGGFTADMRQKPTKAPVKNEARSDAKNARGTLAMARTMVVDSATSQFFINHRDNAFLDHRDPSPNGFGYCVFGRVTEGLDVLDKIAATPTGQKAGMGDVPLETVEIKSIRRAAVE